MVSRPASNFGACRLPPVIKVFLDALDPTSTISKPGGGSLFVSRSGFGGLVAPNRFAFHFCFDRKASGNLGHTIKL